MSNRPIVSGIRVSLVAAGALALCFCVPALAGESWRVNSNSDWCDDNSERNSDRRCEVRRMVADLSGGPIRVDDLKNGGISVEGWDGNNVQIEAKVQSWNKRGNTVALDDISVNFDGSTLTVDGPMRERDTNWGVSVRLKVPRYSDLNLETYNGGISLTDVEGRIRFNTHNGGVSIKGLAGDVIGETMNGGLSVKLSGSRWHGEGLDVETLNGGVSLSVPEGYSADLTTGTVNGRVDVNFPIEVQGKIGKRLETQLGSGGAPVRIMTTNGGVRIKEF